MNKINNKNLLVFEMRLVLLHNLTLAENKKDDRIRSTLINLTSKLYTAHLYCTLYCTYHKNVQSHYVLKKSDN